MDNEVKQNRILIVVGIFLILALLAILFFVPPEAIWVVVIFIGVIVAYFFLSRLFKRNQVRERKPRFWQNFVSLLAIFLFMLVIFLVLLQYAVPSILTIILTVGLTFTVLVNIFTVPFAILHKIKERKQLKQRLSYYPRVSIIVPAYNEEKVLARTIDTLIEADYPHKEIIIVDDGSDDGTYEIASSYRKYDIKAVRRPNGGKFAALNTGLVYATGEIVITVDADSLVARSAVYEIVKGFENPEVAGVAGNLKVYNRSKFLTKLQALEYIIQIHVIRRAFENFGCITVASGAFSAFRRSAIDESGRYDPDYLLEDFDLTIKLLKSHRLLQGNIDAVCYTEAPENIRDVYKQRLSWYRGDFQNFWKHRDAFFNPRFGYMHHLTMPYMLIAMTFVPLTTLIIIATTIIMIINAQWLELIYASAFFIALQFLQSLLGIIIAEDDMRLIVYSPLFIIGYKQFLDIVMLKALMDIILSGGHYLRRERVARIGTIERNTHTVRPSEIAKRTADY
jgi:cellulose synthase/poly-beta-1,6-N-acetylglucosamine synthase-like glycosyltransferase